MRLGKADFLMIVSVSTIDLYYLMHCYTYCCPNRLSLESGLMVMVKPNLTFATVAEKEG